LHAASCPAPYLTGCSADRSASIEHSQYQVCRSAAWFAALLARPWLRRRARHLAVAEISGSLLAQRGWSAWARVVSRGSGRSLQPRSSAIAHFTILGFVVGAYSGLSHPASGASDGELASPLDGARCPTPAAIDQAGHREGILSYYPISLE